MGKKVSSLSNMALTLIIITMVSGASLGYIYKLTKGPITAAKEKKQQQAIQLVVPDFDNNPTQEMYKIAAEDGDSLKVFPAKKDGEVVGVAIESVSHKGFSGDVKIMVGILPDGSIKNYDVLEHKETPGLGTKMATWFKPSDEEGSGSASGNAFFNWMFGIKSGGSGGNTSIVGVNPEKTDLTVSADGGDIDAITAATISSRAFLDAVQKAWSTYNEKADSYSSATTKTNNTEEGGQQ
ncbi:RnfABCDGE type electron transport complex subunit G [Marinilabilia rubra]|uniref:Ion-translocating oxidoreductase complex subunit G n=1 Tax=Marinilabilia rubra TaxID=2162893 RepID=A0A2U2B684_9BACT|nr:RnfABCDGE type electron transport complex subunit G [Marinilabilia rubra]PWD98565.1 electron transporter RnfG [Marinilabilia rubra]